MMSKHKAEHIFALNGWCLLSFKYFPQFWKLGNITRISQLQLAYVLSPVTLIGPAIARSENTWWIITVVMNSDDTIFFFIAAKRIMTLPSVPEERERHHSVATMTNIQGQKPTPKRKMSQWMRRSTRWTLIADNVKVFITVEWNRK